LKTQILMNIADIQLSLVGADDVVVPDCIHASNLAD
jgi:hypothetical protein